MKTFETVAAAVAEFTRCLILAEKHTANSHAPVVHAIMDATGENGDSAELDNMLAAVVVHMPAMADTFGRYCAACIDGLDYVGGAFVEDDDGLSLNPLAQLAHPWDEPLPVVKAPKADKSPDDYIADIARLVSKVQRGAAGKRPTAKKWNKRKLAQLVAALEILQADAADIVAGTYGSAPAPVAAPVVAIAKTA